jgi:hypothetical protein
MLADRENMINHVGRRCTTAAIVPHPRLQGVESLANVLCIKATHLKLEKIFIINTTYPIFCDNGNYVHVKQHTKH